MEVGEVGFGSFTSVWSLRDMSGDWVIPDLPIAVARLTVKEGEKHSPTFGRWMPFAVTRAPTGMQERAGELPPYREGETTLL